MDYVEEAFQIVPGIPLQQGNEVQCKGCEVHVPDPPNSPHIERA